ncbi:MAG: hypothetical protein E3J56_04615 [Candidatus Aminicenantes bacterium]|nr:MAG: hypothetical protein E3J56_04615 [Candidatus Aminicenantes bacterium]
MAKSNNESIERILTKFLDEFHQGKNPKIRDYLRLYPGKEKELIRELTAAKIAYLTFHPERDEKEDEESLVNLLKRLKRLKGEK